MAIIESDGAEYDIEVWEGLFEQAKIAKASFENDFKTSYITMKNAFDQMKNDTEFSGEMRDGFIEVFEILIQYHKELKDELPSFYKAIETFESNLETYTQEYIYQNLGE